jgi:hypothetical protein
MADFVRCVSSALGESVFRGPRVPCLGMATSNVDVVERGAVDDLAVSELCDPGVAVLVGLTVAGDPAAVPDDGVAADVDQRIVTGRSGSDTDSSAASPDHAACRDPPVAQPKGCLVNSLGLVEAGRSMHLDLTQAAAQLDAVHPQLGPRAFEVGCDRLGPLRLLHFTAAPAPRVDA